MIDKVAGLSPAAKWSALVGLSAVLGSLMAWLGVPAALLLGPMAAAIALSACGGRVRVARWPYALSQAIIGCMIARMLPLSLEGDIAGQWPLFVGGVLSVIAASTFLGWLMTRMRLFPGTTGVWGLSSGAAMVMIVMAEHYGADARLVAFMQYLRVIMVVAVVSVAARIFGAVDHPGVHAAAWFGAVAWRPLAETLALAVLGAILAGWLRIRAGALLLPLAGGIVLVNLGVMTIELPRWLLAAGYAVFGWSIGLRFTRELLIHAAKALPRMFACTLALIALCAVLAAALSLFAGIDPLTAFLATSPGGVDSVAIIAAASRVDIPFVMTMQTLRAVAVLVFGPAIARGVVRLTLPKGAQDG
jgi:uncharacterized protein